MTTKSDTVLTKFKFQGKTVHIWWNLPNLTPFQNAELRLKDLLAQASCMCIFRQVKVHIYVQCNLLNITTYFSLQCNFVVQCELKISNNEMTFKIASTSIHYSSNTCIDLFLNDCTCMCTINIMYKFTKYQIAWFQTRHPDRWLHFFQCCKLVHNCIITVPSEHAKDAVAFL